MKLKLRSWPSYLLLVLLAFLFVYNFSIAQKERFLRHGTPLVLRLAPVDPRSLMQGDYMILRFNMERHIVNAMRSPRSPYTGDNPPRKARMVLTEQDGAHIFSRLDDGSPLSPGEVLLEFTLVGEKRIKVGGGSFFFEEGLAGLYNHARYALVRVDKNGKAIISGLLDEDRQPLSKERWDAQNRALKY